MQCPTNRWTFKRRQLHAESCPALPSRLPFQNVSRSRSSAGWHHNATAGGVAVPYRSGCRVRRARDGDRCSIENQSQDGSTLAGPFHPARVAGAVGDSAGSRPQANLPPEPGQGAVIETTLQSKPKESTHWSCRTLAANRGMSKSTVNTIWRSHNLKPHLSKTFKLSRDPRFLEKLTAVVGLYLNPPDKAIILMCR